MSNLSAADALQRSAAKRGVDLPPMRDDAAAGGRNDEAKQPAEEEEVEMTDPTDSEVLEEIDTFLASPAKKTPDPPAKCEHFHFCRYGYRLCDNCRKWF